MNIRVRSVALLLAMAASSAFADSEAYQRYLHGLLAERKGDISTALSDYEKAAELDPGAIEVHRDLAQLNLRTGRTEAALRAATRVRDLAPTESSSFLFLGHVHVARGDLAMAAQEYEKALKLDPDNLKALENLANYYSSINPRKALSYYKRYIEIEPRDAEIYFQMGFLYQKLDDYPNTIAAFENSIKMDPQQVASHLALAELFELQKSTAAAIEHYEMCVQLDPRNPAFHARLGHLYFKDRQWDDAASHFQSARALAPKDPTSSYYLGRIAEEKGQWAEASKLAEEAYRISQDPQFLPLLSYYLTMQRRTAEAVMWLEKAREADPKNANVLLFLGMGYIDLDKTSKAREVLETATRDHPKDLQLKFQLGIAYDRSGEFEKAVAQFERVLEMDPDNAAAMNYLGYSYADRGVRLKEATELLVRAVRMDPTNGAYLDSLGWAYYKQGQYTQAITQLEKATAYNQDALLFEHLGDAYQGDQKPEKALGAWSKALALDPKNRALQKKIDALAKNRIIDIKQRKYLKWVEGNFRQIKDLRGLVLVDGRWNRARLKTQGGVYYLYPDRFLFAIGTPAMPVAQVSIKGQTVKVHPEQISDQWSGFGLEGLTWLPVFFSGKLLEGLDTSATAANQDKSMLHYQKDGEEAWIDPNRGVVVKYIRPSPQGGRDELTIEAYDLVEGLWLPKTIRFKNAVQKSNARLQFTDWHINEPQTAQAFESLRQD